MGGGGSVGVKPAGLLGMELNETRGQDGGQNRPVKENERGV